MFDVVLPVLDEAAAIPYVLERIPPGFRPIVVDNGSVDDSASIARAHGAVVVYEPRRGFGAACYAGLVVATADIVCFMDCDGSLDPGELPRVVDPVSAGTADLMLGRRAGSLSLHSRAGNRVLARAVRRATGLSVRDIGPMRAVRRDALLDLNLQDRRFGWPLEMVLLAARAGWRVAETDVSYGPRIGRSKVTGTVRGTMRTVRDMTAVLR